MSVLQVGNQTISAETVFSLLAGYQMLPQLVQEIIIDRAIAPIDYTSAEQNLCRQQFYEHNQLTTENLHTWLQQQGMTPEQLDNLVIRKLKVEKFKQLSWGTQIESYFLKRKRQLDRVVYSILQTQDAGIAQELFFRLQEDEQSFSHLAQQYSRGPEAQTGGLIGPIEMHTLHPAIAKILWVSQPGQLNPPTYIEDWLVIVRLEKFIPAQLNDSMRQRLLNELFSLWLQAQLPHPSIQPPTPTLVCT